MLTLIIVQKLHQSLHQTGIIFLNLSAAVSNDYNFKGSDGKNLRTSWQLWIGFVTYSPRMQQC